MNQYPLWKNLLILGVVLFGILFALPNVFSQDPSIEIAAARGHEVTAATADEVRAVLENAGVPYKVVEPWSEGKVLVRFPTTGDQLRGQEAIEARLSDRYNSAMTLVADLPGWLRAIDAQPMYLGLDLRGGIQVLIDVDMEAAVEQGLERYTGDIRSLLRQERVRYLTVMHEGGQITVKFDDAEDLAEGQEVVAREFRELQLDTERDGERFELHARLSPADEEQLRTFALQQNITTLRNRVNALGVAEPIVQRQGERRIVVQLPGAQDPARLKEILGATATLEYRLADTEGSVADAVEGRVPVGSRLYYDREGQPILLQRSVIVTGDQITNASSGFDQTSGLPAVFVNLDSRGARRMRQVTTENVGKPMAVVFIENRTVTRMIDGEPVKQTVRTEEVISMANIREPFGRRFQTTGLDSAEEAHTLALFLRAGALAAPIQIVEERTIGPSLGQENIDQGVTSVLFGLAAVLVFMALYYRVFGLVANLVLLTNLVLIVAIMSLLQATLTLPGIAGIVLTMGMAVDANVLIFERIREEIRNGSSPQASINAGFAKALSTIVDANITTLIAAVILFSFGTGPVKGFAVTLSVGIFTSLFTAILGSRAVINLIYGGRRLSKLAI
ncbi:protein translocase subunit SecD [Thiococcus pfennigii]|uniref:protein translocase subunit SecD n=1 Tax=Thiococcus pfennigii TaxID=1057 RepID=UPI00190661D0|nr:protein translocase subunit SecD [Thiococcus pfennigii]MBK1702516.1 protein translocase subunit SecD [Thiococcus pfennigii]MBK1732358.1 protein translocase subunit SecD [Thiococcus pfennigii]